MTIGHFLGGVAALIWDEKTDKYLLLRRSAQKDFLSGDWECVTGRVEQGESYTQAVLREAQEEIGTRIQIEFIIGVTHFYRGVPQPENELLGVIFGCTLQDGQTASFGEEHSELRWATASEVETLLPEHHWLREAIRRAEKLKALLPVSLREEFRIVGFEI